MKAITRQQDKLIWQNRESNREFNRCTDKETNNLQEWLRMICEGNMRKDRRRNKQKTRSRGLRCRIKYVTTTGVDWAANWKKPTPVRRLRKQTGERIHVQTHRRTTKWMKWQTEKPADGRADRHPFQKALKVFGYYYFYINYCVSQVRFSKSAQKNLYVKAITLFLYV